MESQPLVINNNNSKKSSQKKTLTIVIIIGALIVIAASIFLIIHFTTQSKDEQDEVQESYQITTCQGLQAMRNDLNGNYVLMQDIDCSDTKNWNQNTGFLPIGTVDTLFTGSLNGSGFTISNLFIYRPQDTRCGLFGSFNGRVESITMTNGNVTCDTFVGLLVGYADSQSRIFKITTLSGSIKGMDTSGSIVGVMFFGSTMVACRSFDAVVSSDFFAGGLVGYSQGSLFDCSSTNSFISSSQFSGGLAGLCSNVSRCYSSSNVQSIFEAGGLCGVAQLSTTENSYFFGQVSGGRSVGGLFGILNLGNVINSYSSGLVVSENPPSGGLFGDAMGNFFSNYWDVQTSGQTGAEVGGIGLNTTQMKMKNSFQGWDFVNVWDIVETIDYPRLRQFHY